MIQSDIKFVSKLLLNNWEDDNSKVYSIPDLMARLTFSTNNLLTLRSNTIIYYNKRDKLPYRTIVKID